MSVQCAQKSDAVCKSQQKLPLVVWLHPVEKYARQIGIISPSFGVNIKNTWNYHHLEKVFQIQVNSNFCQTTCDMALVALRMTLQLSNIETLSKKGMPTWCWYDWVQSQLVEA